MARVSSDLREVWQGVVAAVPERIEVSTSSEEKQPQPAPAPQENGEERATKGADVTLVEDVKNMLNHSGAKKAFRLGTELVNAASPFLEKPTWWSGGKALVNMGKVLVDDVETWADAYFDGDEWVCPYGRDFTYTVLHALSKFPFQTLKTAEENSVVRLIDLDGVKAGWVYNTNTKSVDAIYVDSSQVDRAREAIKRLLWEQFRGKSLVMRNNRAMGLHAPPEDTAVFEVDDVFDSMPSQRATDYAKHLTKCFDASINRSVMFYGPPRTGKSTLARTLVTNLNLRSFRIRVEDVSSLNNSTLFEAISIFMPDAVILDDFDRAHNQVSLLETLELFHRHVKLIIATVNDRSQLDEAILCPGRFDELHLIDKMDEEVVKHVLGQYSDGFDVVKDWPIAFINEYVKMRRIQSPAEAAESTKMLAKRVERLAKYRDEDDLERMPRAKMQAERYGEDKQRGKKKLARRKLPTLGE